MGVKLRTFNFYAFWREITYFLYESPPFLLKPFILASPIHTKYTQPLLGINRPEVELLLRLLLKILHRMAEFFIKRHKISFYIVNSLDLSFVNY